MLAFVLLAAALATSTPAATDCASGARDECAALMHVLYKSADPRTGNAIRFIDKERWVVAPVALTAVGDRRALIVSRTKETGLPHAESGAWSIYYFAAAEPKRLNAAPDFRRSGSWGAPGHGELVMLDGTTPALMVSAGGTWQGHTCSWTSIDIIEPVGVRELLAPVLMSYSKPGGTTLSGTFERPLTASSLTITYNEGRRIVFAPDAKGRMAPSSPTPSAC